MRPDMKLNVLIDFRVEAYKSFFDHDWATTLAARTDGTKLEEPAFRLVANWKAAANAQFMPWLMMVSIQRFEKSYLRAKEGFPDKLLKDVAESFGKFLEGDISNTVNKKLTKKIRKFILDKQAEMKMAIETWEPDELRPQTLFDGFVTGDGGSELQLAIHGAQRVCYAAIFFEYENFLKTCVRIVTENDAYRPKSWYLLRDDIAATFDPTTAQTCCKDDPVEIGRLIRNSIAHQGGQLTDYERKHLPKGMFAELDGFVVVMPDHNRTLFSALKDRTTVITEATLAKLAAPIK